MDLCPACWFYGRVAAAAYRATPEPAGATPRGSAPMRVEDPDAERRVPPPAAVAGGLEELKAARILQPKQEGKECERRWRYTYPEGVRISPPASSPPSPLVPGMAVLTAIGIGALAGMWVLFMLLYWAGVLR